MSNFLNRTKFTSLRKTLINSIILIWFYIIWTDR